MRDLDAGLGNLFWQLFDNDEEENWDSWKNEINRVLNEETGIGDLEEIPVPLKIAG